MCVCVCVCVYVALLTQHAMCMLPIFICVLSGCTKVSTLFHKRHHFRKKAIQQLSLLIHSLEYCVTFPQSFLKSFQRLKCSSNFDAVGQFRFPKIIILLPPLQNKLHLFCYFIAFEMTGILYCEEGRLNTIQYASVFPTHTPNRYFCTGSCRAVTDHTTV